MRSSRGSLHSSGGPSGGVSNTVLRESLWNSAGLLFPLNWQTSRRLIEITGGTTVYTLGCCVVCSMARRLVNVSSEGKGETGSGVELRKRYDLLMRCLFFTTVHVISQNVQFVSRTSCFSRAAQTRSWKLTEMGVPIRPGVALDYLQPAFCHLDIQSTLLT